MSGKRALIRGTAILTITSFVTRFMGFFYRIFLGHTFGEENVGLYQLVFPVYALGISFSCAGTELALSRCVAQENAAGHPEKAKELLKDEEKEYKLLNYIQTPQHKGEKNHFSFATKFCHYVSLIIFEGTEFEDNYSIYDNVLKKSLCKYVKRYLNLDIKEDSFEKDYKKYIGYIDSIRNKAEELYGKK
mgnify:CR=1 FL=1